jgi:hypothetical protein
MGMGGGHESTGRPQDSQTISYRHGVVMQSWPATVKLGFSWHYRDFLFVHPRSLPPFSLPGYPESESSSVQFLWLILQLKGLMFFKLADLFLRLQAYRGF